MSIETKEFVNFINNFAPRDLEETWDNSGWQINLGNTEVDKVLIGLEITNKVIEEAEEHEVDFILTHHPLIYGSIDVIDNNNSTGNYIIKLIRNDISVYSAHTSFDNAFGGINDDLAERVGLSRIRKLHYHKYSGEQESLMGRMGEYESEKTLEEVCEIVKESLHIDRPLSVVGDPCTKIKKVAVCGGSGADAIPKIIDNCDLLITGDIKHNQGLTASEGGLCVINAGHYDTEKFFSENMGDKLRSQIGDKIKIIESRVNVETIKLL